MEAILDVAGSLRVASAERASGKYLTFMLNDEEYGIEILKIREIIGVMEVTPVPQAAPFVRGVINLRGKVIPVIDLRLKFGLPRVGDNNHTCIIVVDVGMPTGVIVDTVQEVHDIPIENVEPPPRLDRTADTAFILGMGKLKDRVAILLDIDQVLRAEEFVMPWAGSKGTARPDRATARDAGRST